MSNVESRLPVWYIMDEFGSAIQHAEEPNFRVVPLIYLPEQIPYSLLFPIKNLSKDEEVTRDFVEGPIRTPSDRRVLLLPWQPSSFISEDFKQEEPGEEYFLEGHIIESLPNLDTIKASAISLETNMKLKVYSEYELVNNYLTDSRFELTNDEDAANILWYTHHFKQFEDLSESIIPKFVNQFPFEHVITIKDLLSIVCRRSKNISKTMDSELLEMYPLWLPVTYNLKTELTKFVSYFQHRENKGLDNHWICKPWNLARGLDTHITNNINYIVRLPFTGPKIAQKYIEDPVLFNRLDCGLVKFDIRYVLLLKSIQPLEVYVYRNFFLRFANKPFELNDFDIYDKHFTVMNYTDNSSLYRKLCDEFIEDFQTQYAGHQWETLEKKIFSMFLEILKAATCKQPPLSIGHNPQSRALYAADIMLAWRTDEDGCRVMQPKLLEINWTPDCQRACEYYPDFYNDVFSLLFCNEVRDVFVPL
uniref:Tubulin--tyrosine ligase-like protein 12 SET-like domain-containing protein n=2 Tax=Timema TaxID=61471 RepID=A0A7R9NV86_9NEOP|nr:unnamed protein product [Timema tahoe]